MTETDNKTTEASQEGPDNIEKPEARNARDDEIRTYVERLQRLQAEFENYRKRIAREMQVTEERISDREILVFLPLHDNLKRAFIRFASDGDRDSLIAGVEQIFAQFNQILEEKGVRQIEALGKMFDPALHDAVLSVVSKQDKNTVLEEFSQGYVRTGRPLRPSKVAVSRGAASTEKEEEE